MYALSTMAVAPILVTIWLEEDTVPADPDLKLNLMTSHAPI